MSISAHQIRQWLVSDPRRLGVFISLILSLWVIYTNDTLNVDGILYLDAANQIMLGNWNEASKLYHWLFYPVLIAGTSFITTLELELAAILLNTLIFCGMIWKFLTVLKLTGADEKTLRYGLLIICIHPYINEYRADILRDFGYWFLLLWSLELLILFWQTQHGKYGLGWGITIILATAFRIEGVVYVALSPLVFLLGKNVSLNIRIKRLLYTYSLPVFLLLMAGIGATTGLYPIGRLIEPVTYINGFIDTIVHTIPAIGQEMATHVLTPYADDYAIVSVYAAFTTILIISVVKRTTILVFTYGAYGTISKRIRSGIDHKTILAWYIIINLITLIIFVLTKQYLSSRFTMPTALLLAIFAAHSIHFTLSRKDIGHLKAKAIRIITIVFMLFMLVDGLVSLGHSKHHLKNSGVWLKNQAVDKNELLTNNLLVNHYAGIRLSYDEKQEILDFNRKLNSGDINQSVFNKYKYVAIRDKHASEDVMDSIESMLTGRKIMKFGEKEKRQVIVFYKD